MALAISLVALLLALIAAVTGWVALGRSRRARDQYRRIAGSDRDVVDVLLDRVTAIDANAKAVERLAALVEVTRDDVAHSLRHVAVVRYDAFRDVGGRRSFSAALLDDGGDGLVLTTLCGRTDSQTISKGVKGGAAVGLTTEETEAVRRAMGVDDR